MRRAPEAARREILDVAAEFLQTRSYRDLKVGELMEQTEVGRSAFYVYFNDMSDLVEALVLEIEAEIIDSIQAWGKEMQEPRSGVHALLTSTVNLWSRKGPMLSGVFDGAAGDQRVEPALQRVLKHYEDAVASILRHEKAAGLTRPIDCDEIATALVHGSQAYLKQRLGHVGQSNSPEVLTTLEAIWVHTIYPD